MSSIYKDFYHILGGELVDAFYFTLVLLLPISVVCNTVYSGTTC